jgi:hypothetical protein
MNMHYRDKKEVVGLCAFFITYFTTLETGISSERRPGWFKRNDGKMLVGAFPKSNQWVSGYEQQDATSNSKRHVRQFWGLLRIEMIGFPVRF